MAEENFRVRKGITVDGTGDSSIAGNLGIGTTSPGDTLHLTGGQGYMKFGTSGSKGHVKSDYNLELYADDGGNNSASYQNIKFFTAGSNERMRIDDTGKVGIGTTSPSQTLHVQSATAGVLIESTATSGEAPVLDLYKNDSGPAVSEAMATIKFSGENDADQKVTYAEIQSFIEDETDATENAALQFFVQEMGTPRENLRLASNQITFNNSERNVDVLIKSDDGSTNFFSDAGNNRIGIGTTSPASELDLSTGALSFANTNTQLKLSGGSNVDLQLGHWGNAHILIDTDGNDSNRYFAVSHGNATAGSATELMRVQENGD